jgi:hypothetical protein
LNRADSIDLPEAARTGGLQAVSDQALQPGSETVAW